MERSEGGGGEGCGKMLSSRRKEGENEGGK